MFELRNLGRSVEKRDVFCPSCSKPNAALPNAIRRIVAFFMHKFDINLFPINKPLNFGGFWMHHRPCRRAPGCALVGRHIVRQCASFIGEKELNQNGVFLKQAFLQIPQNSANPFWNSQLSLSKLDFFPPNSLSKDSSPKILHRNFSKVDLVAWRSLLATAANAIYRESLSKHFYQYLKRLKIYTQFLTLISNFVLPFRVAFCIALWQSFFAVFCILCYFLRYLLCCFLQYFQCYFPNSVSPFKLSIASPVEITKQ